MCGWPEEADIHWTNIHRTKDELFLVHIVSQTLYSNLSAMF